MGRQLEQRIEFPNHMICIYIYLIIQLYTHIHIFKLPFFNDLEWGFSALPIFRTLESLRAPGRVGVLVETHLPPKHGKGRPP